MEYEQIKQLMEDMGNSKLSSLDIEFPDGIKIKMEKKEEKQIIVSHDVENASVVTKIESEKQIENKDESVSNNNKRKENEQEEGTIVTSPMVGTFYMKSSPNSDPYVEVGSIVKKGDILCIIEAMKLMNEIESEYDGKIAEIFVKDGEPVEYGKPLFRIV